MELEGESELLTVVLGRDVNHHRDVHRRCQSSRLQADHREARTDCRELAGTVHCDVVGEEHDDARILEDAHVSEQRPGTPSCHRRAQEAQEWRW